MGVKLIRIVIFTQNKCKPSLLYQLIKILFYRISAVNQIYLKKNSLFTELPPLSPIQSNVVLWLVSILCQSHYTQLVQLNQKVVRSIP